MANYAAHIAEQSVFVVPPAIPGNFSGVPPLTFGASVIFSEWPKAGARTSSQPISQLQKVYPGAQVTSINDALYHRMHIRPYAIDCGFVVAPQTHQMRVTNMHLESVEMTDLQTDNADVGIAMTGEDPPYTFLPLTDLEYIIYIDLSGAASFNYVNSFSFYTGEHLRRPIVGIRTIVFGWAPQRDMTEMIEWLTDVQESYSGGEDRTQLRIAPRHAYAGEYFERDPMGQAAMRNVVLGSQMQYFVVGLWHESRRIGALSAGATWIPVDTEYAEYRAGGFALLRDTHWRDTEVVQVLEVQAGGLVLQEPLKRSYTLPDIMPAAVTRIDGKPGYAQGPNHTMYKIKFAADENWTIDAPASSVQYKGFDTLLAPYNVSGAIAARNIVRPADIIDGQTGRVAVDPWQDWGRLATEEARFDPHSRADAWAVRQWLHRRAGRFRPVWVPTFVEDIRITTDFAGTDLTLEIEHVNYSDMLFSNPLCRHLAFFRTNGTILLREIVAASADASIYREWITLDSALGFIGGQSDFTKISFLSLCRLVSDKVEIKWQRAGVGQTAVGIIGIDHGSES